MDPQAWQLGLVIGAAVSLSLDWGLRALLHWRRHRKVQHCDHCTGVLGDDGRAELPVERLQCCAWCGDTWAAGKRPEYEPPQPGYRESAADPIQELLRGIPPAPKKGDRVDVGAVFDRLVKEGRPVPGPGKNRLGMHTGMVITDLDALHELRKTELSRKPPPDLPASLPPPRKVQE